MKYLIILIVAFIMIVFFQNAARVDVKFLIWQLPDVPLILVMMASVFVGMMLAFIIDAWQRFRKNRSGFFHQ
ncbi:MAG TPA: lipopolysaccharide assembly protein LapA domain-containing protein [Bacillales bacterium]